MSNPFKKGDKVYHVTHGERTVIDSIGRAVSFAGGCWAGVDTVSFSPWPKPDHARPIEDGWWVVERLGRQNGVEFDVRRVQDGSVVYDGAAFPLKNYVFVVKVEGVK